MVIFWTFLIYCYPVVGVNSLAHLDLNKMAIDYISFAYAASVAAGGIIGYVKAGKNLVRLFMLIVKILVVLI